MTKILLDLPKKLMKQISIIKIKEEHKSKQETIIKLLNQIVLELEEHYNKDLLQW